MNIASNAAYGGHETISVKDAPIATPAAEEVRRP